MSVAPGHYNVTVSPDMGQLSVTSDDQVVLPSHIKSYVYAQANRYLEPVHSTHEGYGYRHYVRKANVADRWTYKYGQDTVHISWSV